MLLFIGGSSKDAEYKLAQSGDATCNGLDSAEVDFFFLLLSQCEFSEKDKEPKLIQKKKCMKN